MVAVEKVDIWERILGGIVWLSLRGRSLVVVELGMVELVPSDWRLVVCIDRNMVESDVLIPFVKSMNGWMRGC